MSPIPLLPDNMIRPGTTFKDRETSFKAAGRELKDEDRIGAESSSYGMAGGLSLTSNGCCRSNLEKASSFLNLLGVLAHAV